MTKLCETTPVIGYLDLVILSDFVIRHSDFSRYSFSNSTTLMGLSNPDPIGAPFTPCRDGWIGPITFWPANHACIARAAFLPSATALTTSWPPLAQSPPVN